jgi:hypothetical protein
MAQIKIMDMVNVQDPYSTFVYQGGAMQFLRLANSEGISFGSPILPLWPWSSLPNLISASLFPLAHAKMETRLLLVFEMETALVDRRYGEVRINCKGQHHRSRDLDDHDDVKDMESRAAGYSFPFG